ncbi:bcl-2 homologous antagonist/killer [Pelodytes ibericus]
MASGGSEEPDRGAELQVDEEALRNETENVFMSYAYHTFQIERAENEDPVPIEDEIQAARQTDSTLDRIGQQLAFIGDDINDRYEKEFSNLLQTLNPDLDNAYDYFKKIASSLFETGVNWGRVLILLGFGYRMAVYVVRNRCQSPCGLFRKVAQYVARYVIDSCIGRWIIGEGGWAAVLKLTNDSIKYVFMILGAVLIFQFLLRHIS